MRRTATAGPLIVLAALALSACSDSGPGVVSGPSAPASTSAPAGGATITGTGYSYSGPTGWTDAKDKVTGQSTAKVDTIMTNTSDRDGFADNVNVIRQTGAGRVTLAAVEAASATQLKSAGASNVQVLPRTQVDGTESSHVTADAKTGPTPYLVEQLYILRDGTSYTVTFSFSKTSTQQARNTAISAVTSSWKWS
ncbi:hypothetical protein [Luteipulveratus mongoliensis]|uniref:PsbP C-terminal domain-containing protein n=1 Tax=Luteipulveratus mongoliensis TaxID=571913 RepID=A0A0K1JIG3_9MICO|nr:hypothetical protein [Luteipulveratus mongoliensis]AKU16370.1 hypothetical protein VV02_11680 [Luteipulveratus mongoliensis]